VATVAGTNLEPSGEARAPSAGIHIGVQGFSPRDWVGTFYPPGLPQRDFLDFYAQVFDSVELNTTFYAIPPARTVLAWARRTPPGFTFTAKMPQSITHEKKLLGVEQEVASFVDRIGLLGDKLGAIVVQFPRSFTRSMEDRLRAFLALLPRGPRFAVEFRSRSWHSEFPAGRLPRSVHLSWPASAGSLRRAGRTGPHHQRFRRAAPAHLRLCEQSL
jgi:uncharacterized protein YecE (DUF72 family)